MLFRIRGIKKIHFVGIGGAGMSGIAEVLYSMGFEISGSDVKCSEITERLISLGCNVYYNHSKDNIKSAEVVVVSSAIPSSNPEVIEAKKKGIPVVKRAEMLAELMRLKYSICVSGSHGKSTTTTMIGNILRKADFDPTVVVGGRIRGTSGGAYHGLGDFIVAEADESDGSFLHLYPTIAVITNIDREHLDKYKNINNLKKAFLSFISRIPFYGCAILNGDDKNIFQISKGIQKRIFFYGLNKNSDLHPENIKQERASSSFDVFMKNEFLGRIYLPVPGIHNVTNALASISVGIELGIPFWIIEQAFREFKGVERRFEFKGIRNGIGLLDDYAHHPTEIFATLKAIRNFWKKGRIFVLFQPHRFTRTKLLYREFGSVFENADFIFILPVYPAGERVLKGVSSTLIYKEVKKHKGSSVLLCNSEEDLNTKLFSLLRKGDLIVTLGAGDVWKIGEKIFYERK